MLGNIPLRLSPDLKELGAEGILQNVEMSNGNKTLTATMRWGSGSGRTASHSPLTTGCSGTSAS